MSHLSPTRRSLGGRRTEWRFCNCVCQWPGRRAAGIPNQAGLDDAPGRPAFRVAAAELLRAAPAESGAAACVRAGLPRGVGHLRRLFDQCLECGPWGLGAPFDRWSNSPTHRRGSGRAPSAAGHGVAMNVDHWSISGWVLTRPSPESGKWSKVVSSLDG